MKKTPKGTTNIRVTVETWQRLSDSGKYGESMDDIIRRLAWGEEIRNDIR